MDNNEKFIRINLRLEPDADIELYNYLKNVPPRRRATLIRTLATQGLVGGNLLKSGVDSMQVTPNLINKEDSAPITDIKKKSFSDAMDDMNY